MYNTHQPQTTLVLFTIKMAEPRIAFKAGRAFRREGTNMVEANATKGAIILRNGGDDGLLHFIWKNRATQNVEEVCFLVLFQ